MPTCIPALGACAARVAPEGRRLAARLKDKLEDVYLPWWDRRSGLKRTRLDLILLPPRWDALILELKRWHLDIIHSAVCERLELVPDGQSKVMMSPLLQACAAQGGNGLERPRVARARRIEHLLLLTEKEFSRECGRLGIGETLRPRKPQVHRHLFANTAERAANTAELPAGQRVRGPACEMTMMRRSYKKRKNTLAPRGKSCHRVPRRAGSNPSK